MDLTITITDDMGETLDTIVIYQDGSDSEETENIRKLLEERYEGVEEKKAPLPEFPDDKYPPDPAFKSEHGYDHGTMETYGADYEKVLEQAEKNERTVWTIVDCDGRLLIIPGLHFVNRMNYYISTQEWDNEELEYAW
jgi:hypothetical protein